MSRASRMLLTWSSVTDEELEGSEGIDGELGSTEGIDPEVLERHYGVLRVPKRIHILGATGSIGLLVAHSLRGIPQPPEITLLLHRAELMDKWQQAGQKISLKTGRHTVERTGYDVELAVPRPRIHGREATLDDPLKYAGRLSPSHHLKAEQEQSGDGRAMFDQNVDHEEQGLHHTDEIRNLIVTVKAPFIVSAISVVKHRLTPQSSIMLMHNGMGVVEELNRELFPDPATRPSYLTGIISHGVHSDAKRPFTATHAGQGTISIGIVPREEKQAIGEGRAPGARFTKSARYLLRTVTRSPVLCAVGFPPTELLQLQLEKLAVNAVVNPMTALLDARNGNILFNDSFSRSYRLLLAEISLVIRSMPELQHLPNVNKRFGPERLETLVVSVARKTGENISSMLADVRRGQQTEIKYINGYIVKKGEELGIRCTLNYLMMHLVMGKQNMIRREKAEDAPFVGFEKPEEFVAERPAPASKL